MRRLEVQTVIYVDVRPDNVFLGILKQDTRKERSCAIGLHVKNQVQQRQIPCRYSPVIQQQFGSKTKGFCRRCKT